MDEKKYGLTFLEAYQALKEGKCVRRSVWLGYWQPDGENIIMKCKDGKVISMKDGCLPMFTLGNTLENDWLIVDDAHKAELDKIHAAKILDAAEDQKEAQKSLDGQIGHG